MAAIGELKPQPGKTWQDKAATQQANRFARTTDIDTFERTVLVNPDCCNTPESLRLPAPFPGATSDPDQQQQQSWQDGERQPQQQYSAESVQQQATAERQQSQSAIGFKLNGIWH